MCWFAAHSKHDPPTYVGLRRLSALGRLKRQIRYLADDIDEVNTSIYGKPDNVFNAFISSGQFAVSADRREAEIQEEYQAFRRRMELPNALDEYAEYLSTLRGQRRNLVRDQEILFLELIVEMTGKPHLREVADLLGAAYSVAGISRDVSEKALADRRDRFKRGKKNPVKLNAIETGLAVVRAFMHKGLYEAIVERWQSPKRGSIRLR